MEIQCKPTSQGRRCKFQCEHKEDNDKDEEDKVITNEHYEEIDKELRSKYDEEFKIDSHDNTMGLFTEDEQVDRYARMLFFWDINQVLNNDDVINDPKLTAKYFYISNMRSELNNKIMTRENEIDIMTYRNSSTVEIVMVFVVVLVIKKVVVAVVVEVVKW